MSTGHSDTSHDVPMDRFDRTHWSVVLAAGKHDSPERQTALETLCQAYWRPIYTFIRRRGYDAPDAQDLTQAFFVRLLSGSLLERARPEKGKFRCLLAVSIKHFLINQAQRARAGKRGGQQFAIPFDEADEGRLSQAKDQAGETPGDSFDREWALTVLQRALERLREDWRRRGKAEQFGQLKVFLSREGNASDYVAVGRKLNLKPRSVAVALHRLRRRYGELIREEIAHTVSTVAEIEDEARYLLELVAR